MIKLPPIDVSASSSITFDLGGAFSFPVYTSASPCEVFLIQLTFFTFVAAGIVYSTRYVLVVSGCLRT